jgi:outer membrane protein TolC
MNTNLRQLVAEIRIAEKEISSFKGTILQESRMNMDLTGKLYRTGEVSLIVYLDSQNSYFDIQSRYYQAITQWKLLKAELEALVGGES